MEAAYGGLTLRAMLCFLASEQLTALSSVAEWASVEIEANGYARSFAVIGNGSYANGLFAPPVVTLSFSANAIGYTFNRIVMWLGTSEYPSAVLTEDPEVAVDPGQTRTYQLTVGASPMVYAAVTAPLQTITLSPLAPSL